WTMRVFGCSPAATATRSQWSPAQLMMKSNRYSPQVVSTTQPDPSQRRTVTRAPVWTRTPLAELTLKRVTDRAIIHDSLLRHVERGDASDMRLDFEHLGSRQPANAAQPILLSALLETAEPGDLCFIRGDDELATRFVRNAVLAAKRGHAANSLHGETRLRGAR